MSTCWRESLGCSVTTRHMNCHRRERSGVYSVCVCVCVRVWSQPQMFRGRTREIRGGKRETDVFSV